MQGAWVPSLVWEDPTSCWTTKPSCRNYWNPCALGLPGQMSPRAATTEALASRACVPQQEKPLRWEAHAPQLESSPHSLQLEKSPHSCKDPVQPKERKKERKLTLTHFWSLTPTAPLPLHTVCSVSCPGSFMSLVILPPVVFFSPQAYV